MSYTEDMCFIDEKSKRFKMSYYSSQYISALPKRVSDRVINELNRISFSLFEANNDDDYEIGGVVKLDKPFFFVILLVVPTDNKPFVLDFVEVDMDTYLDFINSGQTIDRFSLKKEKDG